MSAHKKNAKSKATKAVHHAANLNLGGEDRERISSGIEELNEILHGGLLRNQAYLVRGGPGCGKTTLGSFFLKAGVDAGERVLFITLEESEIQIRQNAKPVGIDMHSIHFLDLSPGSDYFAANQTYDIFDPSEVEREPTSQKIMEVVDQIQPSRIFLDSFTQFRYLAPNVFSYRKQLLSFFSFIKEQGGTLLFTSEGSPEAPDHDLQFLSDGIIELNRDSLVASFEVKKYRGSGFKNGRHTLKFTQQGVKIFPILMPEEHGNEFTMESISSGVPELDQLLNGGVERGTSTLITGPTGVGKTTLGMQFMKEAAGRGERSALYVFEESKELLYWRGHSINIPLQQMVKSGNLYVEKIEPMHYSADEFFYKIRKEVEQNQCRLVMIDSLSGFKLSIAGRDLVQKIHSLSKYLTNMGVTVFLIVEVESITGNFHATDEGISYLGDNIIFFRYIETKGALKKAIGVLKKRLTNFEKNAA